MTIGLPGLPDGARPLRLIRIKAAGHFFQMGSPESERGRNLDEGPVHVVTFDHDYYLSETEVTQAQWKALMGINPATDLLLTTMGTGDNYPVYNVSWTDITQQCGFLYRMSCLGHGAFRLPTKAEWEYACRAGTTTRFSFGDSLDCGDDCNNCEELKGSIHIPVRGDHLWYCGNNFPDGAKELATKPYNGFGLFDMHGRFFEWCQDTYHFDYQGAPNEGSSWEGVSGNPKVASGGYWGDFARDCRSAVRRHYSRDLRDAWVGFGLARAP